MQAVLAKAMEATAPIMEISITEHTQILGDCVVHVH